MKKPIGLAVLLMLYGSIFCVHNGVPRISIITSLYKGGLFIQGFMEDIVQQTIFDQCELIIIDAHSPDNEYEIIKPFLNRYSNIIYLRLETDPGLYAVWNQAIGLARGAYITNANVDDRLAFNCYQIHADALDTYLDIDLVYSDALITDVINDTWLTTKATKRLNRPAFSLENLKSCCLPNNHPMWRASLHKQYGLFDESFQVAGDWEMWLRAATGGSVFLLINKPLGLFYDNSDGLSTGARAELAMQEFWRVWHMYH